MDAFLAQPPVQSGLAPFVVSLVLGAALLRASARWQGIAILGGFLVAVVLIVGPALTPLTSTRKIVLASLAVPLLALALDYGIAGRWPKYAVIVLSAIAALLWVLWPVLLRLDVSDALLQGGGLALFVAVVVLGFGLLSAHCARFAGAAVGLSLATGAAVILAASALYGQLSFALTAAVGGLAVLRLFVSDVDKNTACFGFASAIAVAVPLALLAAAASVYAKLPVTTLPLLAFAPLLALVPLVGQRPAWQRGVVAALLALLPSAIATYLVWASVEDSGYSGY